MTEKRLPGQLRPAGYYIFNALKFYELRNEKLTPIIFIIFLITGFLGNISAGSRLGVSPLDIILSLFIILVNTTYLHAFIGELRGGRASLGNSAAFVFKNILLILGAQLFFLLMVVVGAFLLIIPGFIIYFTSMFFVCFIVDEDARFLESFKKSKEITRGKRLQVFAIGLLFTLLLFLPVFLLIQLAAMSGNELILRFILLFSSTVTGLMNQRLLGLLYYDLNLGQAQ